MSGVPTENAGLLIKCPSVEKSNFTHYAHMPANLSQLAPSGQPVPLAETQANRQHRPQSRDYIRKYSVVEDMLGQIYETVCALRVTAFVSL